jgi:hypothetical protein
MAATSRPAQGYPEYKQIDIEKGGTYYDEDESHSWAEQHLRMGFIRKVFGEPRVVSLGHFTLFQNSSKGLCQYVISILTAQGRN